ncbi:hypothetical protein QL285_051186 [Trifolium repens]|nr:hypothetical protein QL285_051186 [Trifolium repens]
MDSFAPCLEISSRIALGVVASFGVISSAIIGDVALFCIVPSFVGSYFCLLCCILIFCFPSVFLTILKDWVMLKYWCHREDGGQTRPRENNVATSWRFLFFFKVTIGDLTPRAVKWASPVQPGGPARISGRAWAGPIFIWAAKF